MHHSNVPSLSADPARGTHVYAAWLDADGRGCAVVAFARSVDRGATWSAPFTLSEQASSQRDGDYDATIPTVAVNRDGIVGVAWYDTRGASDRAGRAYRFRASRDGGLTWCPSIRVSAGDILGGQKPPGPGHTGGLAASADGAFHAVWVDDHNGRQHARTAAVRVVASSF